MYRPAKARASPNWRARVSNPLFAFLTTEPNLEVGAIHPKAMPVIFTKPEECEAWLSQPWEQAKVLQRPLPDGALKIVVRGVKEDVNAIGAGPALTIL